MQLYNPIPIDTQPVQHLPEIVISPDEEKPVPVSREIADLRASKIDFALPDPLKTTDDLYEEIISGQEKKLRAEASDKINSKKSNEFREIIGEYSKKKGGPLTSSEIVAINESIKRHQQFADPTSVFEEATARKYTETIYGTARENPGSWFDEILKAHPKESDAVIALGETFIAKQQFLNTKLEDLRSKAATQSWPGYLADRSKEFFSLGAYGEVKERAQVPGTSFFPGFLGTNIEAQRLELWRKPLPEFKATVTKILNGIEKDNPELAVKFGEKLAGLSDPDFENLLSVFNITTFPGIPTVGRALTRTVKDVVQTATGTQPPKILAPASVGNLHEAAVQKATLDLAKNLKGQGNPVKDSIEALPMTLNSHIEGLNANVGPFREATNRIVEAYHATKTNLYKILNDAIHVERLPGMMAVESSVRKIMESVIKDLPVSMSNRVLDVVGPSFSKLTKNYFFELQLGQSTAKYFGRYEAAVAAARNEGIVLKGSADMKRQFELQAMIKIGEKDLPTIKAKGASTAEMKTLEEGLTKFREELNTLRSSPGATIERNAMGFYISKWIPLDETKTVVRDLLLELDRSKLPLSTVNYFIGKLRTPGETTSADAQMNARIATYGPNSLLVMAQQELDAARKLAKWTFPGTKRKERWLDLERTMKFGQTARDPTTGEMGYTFKSAGELNDHYLRYYGRSPIDAEVEAYFAWVRFTELDAVYREISMFTKDSRVGAESQRIITRDRKGARIESPDFDGIVRPTLPGGEDNVAIMGRTAGRETIYNPVYKPLSSKKRREIEDGVLNGSLKIVEVLHPEYMPLKDFGALGNSRVRYIVTPTVETKPLALHRLPRRGGGHLELDYDLYIKQADMHFDLTSLRNWYNGDRTLMPISNGAMGRDIIKKLENVRVLLRAGKEAEAEVAGRELPIDWKEHRSWYNETHGPGGVKIAPRLSLTEPFRLVPKNKLIVEIDNELPNRFVDKDGRSTFKDGTRQGSIGAQNQVDFTGKRDGYEIFTINDVGTRNNPLYKWERANLVDPIPSMNRALSRIINSTYLDDYKTFSIEHWIQQAKGYIDATPAELSYSPTYYFHKGEFKAATPDNIRVQLENQRYTIKQILGVPSKVDTVLHKMSQDLADSIYGTAGPTKLDPSWMLPMVSDAGSYMRSVTYHAVIGLFSIPQLIVQSMTYATILGIAGGSKAIPGTLGAFLHQLGRINPKMLDKLDDVASKFHLPGADRWRPGEFKEARDLMMSTGFHIVAGEHIIADNPLSAKIFTSGGKTFLDAGTIFFKGGERNSRFGAWYTAYREFRAKNPTGRITNYEKGQIFDRADLLAGDMSKASKSFLQRGPLAFPTQFLAYNLRLMELMTGKRLSMKEKTRLFTTYAGLFGVSAFGLAGFPFGDMIRRAAIDNGYIAGDEVVRTWAMEGIPSALLQMATGRYYNIGQRFGSPGFDQIRDIMTSDKPWWELAGGASWSLLSTSWEHSNGFREAMMSLLRDEDSHFPLRAEDFVAPLKSSIATANSGVRLWEALNTTNWLSKKGQILDKDVGPWEATLMTLTGVQRQPIADIHSISILEKDKKASQKNAEDEFLVEFNKYVKAVHDNNPEQAKDYGKRFRAILIKSGYPIEKYGALIARAAQGNESMINRAEFNFYLRNQDPRDREAKQKAYTTKLKLQQGVQ